MAKAKNPRLGLSFLNSFQICRPKNPSSMIRSPLSAASYHTYSPINSKIFDISFPSFPDPPPSTPSKITPPTSACQSFELENQFASHAYSSKPRKEGKTCNSPASSDSDETDWPLAHSRSEKKKHKNARKKGISSGDSNETDSLFSSPPSFNSSHDFNHPLRTIYEQELGRKTPKQKSEKSRRFKRYGSKEWKEGGEYDEKKEISGRLAPCAVGGKVNQSFVVVKRSVDPYGDFKKSMSEMIMEKQIFEPNELEQLLMSFLSLNSRLHHKVIVEAFTEALKEVFRG